jgi:EAL and modified HD-GYP domain-containing signal transduction protein
VLDALAGRGYALALHGLPGPDFDADLLDLFATVEVDMAAWDEADAAAAAARIMAQHATPLAVGLVDHREFERAKALDFQLFAGRFYASPRMAQVRNGPVGAMSTLVSVVRLQSGSMEIEDLERVIDTDVGLSVRLLRYINPAYFGLRTKVTSIRHGAMMLGARGLSRWALLVALTGGPSTPRELSVMALTRAKMCASLGGGRAGLREDELFTIGLLSAADALLDQPLATIVSELSLADEIADALLEHAGSAGSILDAVLAYEAGDFAAESVRPHLSVVANVYRDALRWAQETVAEVGA